MMRKSAAIATCLAVFCGCGMREKRPNIVLFSVDTLRPDRLGCLGGRAAPTPNFDRLAASGFLFENVISQANWTLPSHASLFTSLYPQAHLVETHREKMSDRLETLAEVLRGNGYKTAAFTDGAWMARSFGFNQGFDHYDDRSRGEEKDARFLDWIRKNGDGEFFAFYHTYDVHEPYIHHPRPEEISRFTPGMREEIIRKVRSGDYDFADEEYEAGIVCWYTMKDFHDRLPLDILAPIKGRLDAFGRERWPEMPNFRKDLAYIREAYEGGVRYADQRIGALIDELDGMGLKDSTVVVVTSDHGECLFEHKLLEHPPVLYDEIVRVPLIIRYPPLGGGERFAQQQMTIDVMPTLLDIARATGWPPMQGRSLLPLMQSGRLPPRDAFSDSFLRHAVRSPQVKYIERVADGGGELYELSSDPGERRNRASSEPERAGALSAKLEKWREENRLLSEKLGLKKERREEVAPRVREELRALGYLSR